MKHLKILILLPLSIFCLKLSAQVEDLLRNPAITWVAETYVDIITENPNDSHAEYINYRRTTNTYQMSLKFLNLDAEEFEEQFILQKFIVDAFKKGEMSVYEDADCKKLKPYSDFRASDFEWEKDTTIYEFPRCHLGWSLPSFRGVDFFRVHQILFYRADKAQFGLKTIAIAPMIKASETKWRPYFWIKPQDLAQKPNLNDASITWASCLTHTDGNAVREDSVTKVLKLTNGTMPIDHFWQTFRNNPDIPFYDYNSDSKKEKLTLSERQIQGREIRVDTITEISPITYHETQRIHFDTLKMTDLERLRFKQNWCWDNHKKQLNIYLEEVALLKNIYEEGGELLYRQPVFYRRNDD